MQLQGRQYMGPPSSVEAEYHNQDFMAEPADFGGCVWMNPSLPYLVHAWPRARVTTSWLGGGGSSHNSPGATD